MLESLKQLARGSGPGKKLPTLREMVKQLGVSQTTIIRAVEVLEREGVLARRHGSGIYVTEGPARTKLLVLCEAVMMIDLSPFWGVLLEEVLAGLVDAKIPFELRYTSPDVMVDSADTLSVQLGEDLKARIGRQEYAAALVIGVHEEVVQFIDDSGIRVVAFAAPGHYIVQVTSTEVINLGLTALCERNCRLVSIHGVDYSASLDFAAALLEMKGGKLAPSSQLRAPRVGRRPYEFRPDRIAEGYDGALRLFGRDRSDWPDGVLSVIEGYTVGFLHGMMKLGIKPGVDIVIATHSNCDTSPLLGFEDKVIRISYEIPRLSGALVQGALCLMAGAKLQGGGWETGVEVEASDRLSLVQFVKPKILPVA